LQNKYKATIALIVSGFGAYVSTSWADYAGQMLHHGLVAATVGGLADWYAVTALFRKPLWVIGYRTQILRRNRKRIMESIVTFAADDMLSPKNIMARLERENTAELFVTYLTERGGRERVKSAICSLMLSLANTVDPAKVAAVLAPTAKAGLDNFGSRKIFHAVIDLLAEPKHCRPLLLSLLSVSREILFSPILQHFIKNNIHNFRQNYEGSSAGRTLVLSALDLTDERILELLNQKAGAYLNAAINGDNEALTTLEQAFENILNDLRQDARIEGMIGNLQAEYLAKLDINTPLTRWLEENLKGDSPFWLEPLKNFIDAKIDEFAQNAKWQESFDGSVKNFLAEEIAKHHDALKNLIRARLDDFSDDELTDFVESKVADDLQMIRINGSVVGGLVGMVLFVLMGLIERLHGL